jgi:hypothetical protein
MMDQAKVNYSRKTIVQASHLKLQIESLSIRKDRHTMFSLDISRPCSFYPSVTYCLLKRAIEFSSHSLGEKEKAKIKVCLKKIEFGMGNTWLTFGDKKYNE